MATAARRPLRWGALMGVATAIRSASRPGSPSLGERLAALPRMARAVMTRRYTGVDGSKLLMMLAAAGYVVSPIDLMPEAILFLGGLGDDALVIGWLSVTIINATDDFLDWERNRTAYRGQVVNDEAYADPRARGPRTGGDGTRDGGTPHYDVV
ncbi:MAG TPA: YkvA family protein [Ornithinicoccus sp.]|nr:YkvA family protein [Ornithinicoccus sp.]